MVFPLFENVSFEINEGEAIAIIGQNGAGKTTTVKNDKWIIKANSWNGFD